MSEQQRSPAPRIPRLPGHAAGAPPTPIPVGSRPVRVWPLLLVAALAAAAGIGVLWWAAP